MNTLQFLILKKLVKRSPKSTREGIKLQLSHIHPETVSVEISMMVFYGWLVYVNDGSRKILRISTDFRRLYPEVMHQIQSELDNEK